MTQSTRSGGMAPLCLRPLPKNARWIPNTKLALHPLATPAFETYRNIRVSARISPSLADPLLVVRSDQGRALFFGNFAARMVFADHETMPVIVFDGLEGADITRFAWAEITKLAFNQLHPRGGFQDLKRALLLSPEDVTKTAIGQIGDAALARHLAVDVSRFRGAQR
ncbi:hypothetical protein Dshi_4109 (plasmid) [Dinoroseobacter shibae DFL 12 = DSM 16493]|jgi:hypothetical protein|uniref:Uncharacterized protein n=1 Tax=Dinoroseobacter shibae (strain DSM 16493 / NCIMB 14021 / DFL 12) TaxID=398580 RepID=A8LUA9_DINSH|nr:hypothetical protein [Dinoroseobacter shibae]ABV95826.1 hypothetical protein Dshi_4109 [Dinoroseobacter shibae DFL 12 = DSM 16493]URF49135.1 hypothetical protein M8008_21030 [Dinoroseobacter shibae]URF53442.1 hypothetical protein M8007_21055 [Dinoroseobacter shibae]